MLAGLEFFKKAVKLQKKHAREGTKITNALQTNGTLIDDEWGKFLHDEEFLIGISLDGPEDLHNKYRLDAKGEGSFKSAMLGLEALKRNKVEFNSLTCIQNDNAEHPVEVYDFLKNTTVKFMQFIPIVEPVTNGKPAPESPTPKQFGNFMTGIFDRWLIEDVGDIFVQHFDMLLGMVMGYPASLCAHSKECGRALAMEHNGDLFSSDHFVTRLDLLGSLKKLPLVEMVDSSKQREFGRNKSATLPGYCQKCEYLRLCYGGCPANRTTRSANRSRMRSRTPAGPRESR